MEMLAYGIAAERDAAASDDRLPRETSGVPALLVAGKLRRAREADELRDLRIGMKAREFVLMAVERIEYAPMLPAPGRIKILWGAEWLPIFMWVTRRLVFGVGQQFLI